MDQIGEVTITNDGATILKQLEVEHPAAKVRIRSKVVHAFVNGAPGPRAQVLCELADLQDQEVGDGTTSVVILAAELLKVRPFVPPPCHSECGCLTTPPRAAQRGNELVRQHIHPTSIITGFRLAMKEAVRYVKENLVIKSDTLAREHLINAAKVGAPPAPHPMSA